jgi:hypothetical protein
MRAALIFVVLAALHAEVIDRITVTVGRTAIMESDIRRQMRLVAFLNKAPYVDSGAIRRETANRMIEQTLVKQEIKLSHYPYPGRGEIESTLADIKKEYPDEAAFNAALFRAQITVEQLEQHLIWQLALVRFTELRFRPTVQIANPDVLAAYRRMFPGPDPPPLREVRDKIEEALMGEQINKALDRWLRETRAATHIEIREDSFK